METQMVSSTDIESVGYDSSTSTLEIRFHSRGVIILPQIQTTG